MIAIDEFRDACARFATGVAIVTVLAPDGSPHGLTVSSFTSVSLAPPLVLVCIDQNCTVLPHFLESRFFAVNVLSDEQRELSVTFSVKPEGRFEGVSWEQGLDGQPLLHNSLAHFECRRVHVVKAGDHEIVIGEALRVHSLPGEPLLYFDRNYHTIR